MQAGLTFVPVAVGLSVFSPRSAGLVRRFGAKRVCSAGLLLVTASFSGYRLVDENTPIAFVMLLLLLQGSGMAHVIAPATESIMSTLPRERAGTGSAVNTTIRQVGGALGVAILGSILSASYRTGISPALAGLPARAREVAGESIGGTDLVAAALPDALRAPLEAAGVQAFVDAMHTTALGSALAAAIGVAVVLRWMPGRNAVGPAVRTDEDDVVREPVAA